MPSPNAPGARSASESEPLVSVVLPIYNARPYLREALDSIVAQTYQNLEIICVNDGSTDDSLAIIGEYAARDGRFVVDDGPNGGYGRAMNRGIARATGKWLGILEPDDLLLPGMFERLVAVAERDELDFVRADFNRFTSTEAGENVFTLQTICPGREYLYNKVLNPQDDPDLLNVRMQNGTGITRLDLIRDHDIRLHESPGARFQDNGLWFQTYFWAERIEYVDEPFYCHRDDNPNSSTNRTDLMFAMMDEWAWIREKLDSYPERGRKFVQVFQYRKFQNCNFAFRKLADELQLPYLERFGAELKEARDAGELDLTMFSKLENAQIAQLIDEPQAYLNEYRAKKERAARKAAASGAPAPAAAQPPQGALALFAHYVRTEGFGQACAHVLRRAKRLLTRGRA